MSFKPSKFQQAIFDFITKGKGNAVINAVAGSGKTTTLLQALGLLPKTARVLFLAFNKSIKTEISEKVTQMCLNNVTVNTCHGFGFSALLKSLDNTPKIDNLKYRKLLRALVVFSTSDDFTAISDYKFSSDMMPLVKSFNMDWADMEDANEYKQRVLKLADLGRMNLTTDVKGISELAHKYGISLTNGEATLSSNLISLASSNLSSIDFADMIYLPNKLKLSVDTYDFVFVDECQDLNSAQRELMLKTLTKDSRFVAVGDKNQAIYGFAGADADSFDKLTTIANTIMLPLSVCYRCGSDIIARAKSIVPQIEAFKGSKKGKVNTKASVKDIMDGDMVLCRNTYPLVKLCLAFLKDGKKATIMGGDIGKSLIKMLKDTNAKDMSKAFDKMYHNLTLTVNRIMRSEKCTEADAKDNNEYVNLEEKIQVIEALVSDKDTVADVVAKLEAIFDDSSKEGIILSSIHKSKGLEADRVFIIHSEKMPSPFAKQEWEMVQEENLRYVAYTRAKSLLADVVDFDAYADRGGESKADSVKPVKDSKHVGVVGGKVGVKATVTDVRYIPNYDANVFVMEDKDGNIFEKWGSISSQFIVSNHTEAKVGTLVEASMLIKRHTEFRGVKANAISRLSKYVAK